MNSLMLGLIIVIALKYLGRGEAVIYLVTVSVVYDHTLLLVCMINQTSYSQYIGSLASA